jgi:hypothetical protein
LEALQASLGRLTAPPLAAAAVLLSGPSAIPALNAYMRADLESRWGSVDFVAAALHRLGATMAKFGAMLSLADRLQANGA